MNDPNPCHVEQGRPTKEGGRRRNIRGMIAEYKPFQGVLSMLWMADAAYKVKIARENSLTHRGSANITWIPQLRAKKRCVRDDTFEKVLRPVRGMRCPVAIQLTRRWLMNNSKPLS